MLRFNLVARHRILDWTDEDRKKCLEWLGNVTGTSAEVKYSERDVAKLVERMYKVYVINKLPSHVFTPRQEENFYKWLENLPKGIY